jgi:hypothetical protein
MEAAVEISLQLREEKAEVLQGTLLHILHIRLSFGIVHSIIIY